MPLTGLINGILYNLVWAACVAGREQFLLPTALGVSGYLLWLTMTRTVLPKQILMVACIGLMVDGLLVALGVFDFSGNKMLPLWMGVLWLAFATTLPLSLEWFGRHRALAALTGALGFPLSYYMGHRLDAVDLPFGVFPTLLLLAMIWAVLLPVMYWSITRLGASNAHTSS